MTASNRSRLHNAPSDLALSAAPEEGRPWGSTTPHHPLRVGHAQHVQEEREVPPGLRGDGIMAVEAVVGGRGERSRLPSSSG